MATIKRRNGTYKITVSCGYDLSGKQFRNSSGHYYQLVS